MSLSPTNSSSDFRYQDESSTLDVSGESESYHDEPMSYREGFKDDPNDQSSEPDAASFLGLSPPTTRTPPSPPTTTSFRLETLWHNLCQGFTSLRDSPPELRKAFVLKFLDSYSYFSFSIIFTLFLSNDFGLDDVTAGTLYGAWGALITIYGLLTGFVVDNLGVAQSLKLGFILSLLARIGIFLTTSRTMLYIHVCGTLPLANCLGIPVLTTGIRRYTNETNRGFAFGLFYVIMNVAALISGPAVDLLTIWYKGDKETESEAAAGSSSEEPRSWSMTSYRAIILTGIISNVLAVFVSLTVREIKVDTQEEVPPPLQSTTNTKTNKPSTVIDPMIIPPSPAQGVVRTFRPRTGSPWKILRETSGLPVFRRFLLVCLIMLNVRMIFRHLDATLPKYMVREFGPDVAKGTIYSINPAIIIILVPIVTAMTSHVDPLVMMHYGSYVSAASVFILAISTSIWACVVFVTILSLGEAIWSPRLYDYTVTVCPEGREGTFMALSSAPMFLAKLPVGFLSGVLLQRYCPLTLQDGEERHSQTMWLIIGLLTASSPVLMTCCWNYISKKDSARTTEFDDTVNYTELQQRSTME
ncbi:major facilitator superfamily transporter [Nitzschia inconspicua]|uniref:Major facilitator superfamily transporter n=1 Tax=Nitzschia inconspicua TaxID=303405 RepID=A0A9K3KBI2_9STRA|nr:major facilitator superfamily transporter [Nitzschia inconspicua]